MHPKKSLGQHFLNGRQYIQAVANAADLVQDDTIIEVGPGKGVLTKELLLRGVTVVAIEKDSRLIPFLLEKFSREITEKKFVLIQGDVLEFEIPKLPKTYKVVANIPYYITGSVIRKFLTAEHQPTSIVFLIQKEVAQRIARSKKESILSLSVKAYGIPTFIKKVPRGAFSPPPTIDSAILKIESISRNNFADAEHEKLFFELLHAGFGKKRKLLRNNLKEFLGVNASVALCKTSIPENARAEDVKLAQWLSISKH